MTLAAPSPEHAALLLIACASLNSLNSTLPALHAYSAALIPAELPC